MALNPFDGPIPGANFTSDTKNYPWHRPPEVTDLDDAIELAAKRLMSEEVAPKILTMVEMKLPIVRIADIFVTGGIGQGKWTPDMAIMLAGPVTHIIKIMADGYGIKGYNLGLDKKQKPRGKAFYQEAAKIDEERAALAAQNVPSQLSGIVDRAEDIAENEKSGNNIPVKRGFMGMANPTAMIADEGSQPNQQASEGEETEVI